MRANADDGHATAGLDLERVGDDGFGGGETQGVHDAPGLFHMEGRGDLGDPGFDAGNPGLATDMPWSVHTLTQNVYFEAKRAWEGAATAS